MVERIACFLTCGYTEAGAMQFFLRKLNDRYEYKQYLPNKTIKKKGDPKSISKEISGLTGDALLEKIYNILEKNREEISACKAVLIEDDLDGKFHDYDDRQIAEYKDRIIAEVHSRLHKDIPVWILYASPEVESWFLADWKNGFEYLYCDSGVVTDVEHGAKQYFSYHLKQYINQYVLKQYSENIEEFGWFQEKYVKLSDLLISAVQTEVKTYICEWKDRNESYANQIKNSRDLYYSKKLHGDRMLRNIQPQAVAEKCRKYFRDTYNEIRYAEL